MAVSFKVPSSPARSIFEIDEFLGVDLTNSGTNVEEHRSPNAENMVRLVPGKVRKRTGYKDNIIFSDMVDVNRAKNTSDEWMDFTPEGTTAETSTQFFELYETIPANTSFYARYEVHFKGKYTLIIGGTTGTITSEEPMDKVLVNNGTKNSLDVSEMRVYADAETYSEDNFFYVKNVMVTKKTNKEHARDLEWSPAPEDMGAIVVENDEIAPIYGVHSIKTNEKDGNRVVNVNRALNTSDNSVTYNLTSSITSVYTLGEYQYPGRKVYIDFDYEVSGNPITFYCCGKGNDFGVTTEERHFSTVYTVGDTQVYNNVEFKSKSTSSTLKIKNFTLVYEKDENYKWSPAPEDNGMEFDISDTYFTGSKDFSLIKEFSDSTNASSGQLAVEAIIGDASSNVQGFARIRFSIHTASYNTLNSVKVSLINDVGTTKWTKTFTKHIDSERFDMFLNCGTATDYIKKIKVEYSVGGNGACWTSIKNIEINQISARDSYDVASRYYLYHVGKNIFLRADNSKMFAKVYTDANRAISSSWQLENSLFILDGKEIYSYSVGDETIIPIGNGRGYIPTITIGKAPNGGGTPYESVNMLQPAFYETFYVPSDASESINFYLSFGELDATEIKAWVLNSSATWIEKKEGSDFIVNRGSGMISFFSAPGTSPLTGEDNVKILAYRTIPGYKERVTSCTIGTLFGVNGASDRLFLSGNPDYPNWDFYSEQYDPTYFPDTGYSSLGLSSSKIVGYARVNNYLATFKDEYEPSQSVFIREGDLVTDPDTKIANPAFKLINTLQGNGVIAPHSFGYLQTEPLFLTRSGIFAITPQDMTGEKYSQNRSFFLNGQLTKEPNLEDAYAVVYNDMYVLALNEKLYILDGLQPIRTDRSEPYATRQYVGFYCTNVPAICLWTEEQALWFGTEDGRVCKFATDIEDLESYNDNGKEIYCCWETPDLDGKLFYKNKSFRYIAIRMMAALKTSAKLYSMARGAWNFIKEDKSSGIFFDFENLDFDAFSFSTDRSDKVAHSKIRVKKVDKARFKIENGNLNEPFGLMNLALEYVESGNYKG